MLLFYQSFKASRKSIDLDKDVLTKVAAHRGGVNFSLTLPEMKPPALSKASAKINIAVENYPTLNPTPKSWKRLERNSYLQKEITVARELYNDDIAATLHSVWPVKMVALKPLYFSNSSPPVKK